MAAAWSPTRDMVIAKSDVVIYLDYPAPVTLWRLTKRTFARLVLRRTCCNGNKETVANFFSRDNIFLWWWSTRTKRHEEANALAARFPDKTLVLSHPADLDRLIDSL